ncbi:ATP-binding cassette sub-family C member 4 isoform X2 [Nematostella vectensis]|uniref:ATP-binding cassette sub-family C member 4 isoform X2 n=1 Tax=Nematostella vectensis TaxID=45351 RepID=UPI00207706FC|nr:ATP-binding cassette sub-family C member 4 isoform X2 [Nematostella vectensis]
MTAYSAKGSSHPEIKPALKMPQVLSIPSWIRESTAFLFFTWMNKTLNVGNTRRLKEEDLIPLQEKDRTEPLLQLLDDNWSVELQIAGEESRRPRLWRALLQMFSKRYCILVIGLKLLASLAGLLLAILVWFFLRSLSMTSHMDQTSAGLYVMGITTVSLVKVFASHHSDYQSLLQGMRLLYLSRAGIASISTGSTINLASNDSLRLERAVLTTVYGIAALFEISVALVLLVVLIGWQALSGVLFYFIVAVYISAMAGQLSKLNSKSCALADERLGVIGEVIAGIRTVKMLALEWFYRDKVNMLRRKEMRYIRIKSLVLSSFSALYFTSTSIATLISISSLLYADVPLSVFKIFTLVMTLNIMRFSVTVCLTECLRGLADAKVAVQRIERFLVTTNDKPIGTQTPRFRKRSLTRWISPNKTCTLHNNLFKRNKNPYFYMGNKRINDEPVLLKMRLNHNPQKKDRTAMVDIRDVSACWAHQCEDDDVTLTGIKLKAVGDDLVIITGPVGGGKSSLLLSILGEIPLISGSISVRGRIAYVPQIPWISSGTIRENITFGKQMEEERYNKVLEVCSLVSDLSLFPRGDLTVIGERGASLSGGQQSRVSLARAVYADVEIYLLDDPFSSLDSKVGQDIFNECIQRALSNKLKILVTHQIKYFNFADCVIFLSRGKIGQDISQREDELNSAIIGKRNDNDTEGDSHAAKDDKKDYVIASDSGISEPSPHSGSYHEPCIFNNTDARNNQDIMNSGGQRINAHKVDIHHEKSRIQSYDNECFILDEQKDNLVNTSLTSINISSDVQLKESNLTSSNEGEWVLRVQNNDCLRYKTRNTKHSDAQASPNKKMSNCFPEIGRGERASKILLQLHRASGRERNDSFIELGDGPIKQDLAEDDEDYQCGSVGWRVYWSYFRAGLPTSAIVALLLYFLLAQVSLIGPNWWLSRLSSMQRTEQRSSLTLGIYGTIVGCTVLFISTRAFLFFHAALNSSCNLHDTMVMAIIKSPALFFDTNPIGRILNRLSRDIACMDDLLPNHVYRSFSLCLFSLSALILPAGTNVWLTLAVVPLIGIYVYLGRYFLRSSRELKRLESVRCSPVYSHIAETIDGIEVVRASNMQRVYLEKLIRYQDLNTQASFLVLSSARWMALRLDLLTVLSIAMVATGALLASQDAALAGLSLTFAMESLDATQFGVRQCSEVENDMTSTERVLSYTNLPPEPGYSRTIRPHEDWPEQGALSLRDVCLAYTPNSPCVLRDITLDVRPGERVGIVGKTGAGKSSVFAALFRMPDPTGEVWVDGVELASVEIRTVRKALAVITQNPVLFSGSLRENLDPNHRYEDQEIWTVLKEVQLYSFVQRLPDALLYQVGEGGTNFSVGQRQLLCLARALLQKCKILVLDEATANVDYRTDRLIQEVIQLKFSGCTVLTIAHRLSTITDYDRIVVIDNHQVAEVGTPMELVRKNKGLFACMMKNSTHENMGISES